MHGKVWFCMKGYSAAKVLLCMSAGVLLAGCGKAKEKSLDEIQKGGFTVSASVHDPSIVEEDGKYYIFGTHMESAVSDNLRDWTSFSSGVNKENPLFDNLFDEDLAAFQYVGKNDEGGYSVWAPDVIYNEKLGKYVMYFCTSSTYKKSTICMATADKIDGPYHYEQTLLYSGFSPKTIKETNFFEFMPENTPLIDYLQSGDYDNSHWPNCIDPTLFYDEDGRMWMVYGSWSGGIFLLEIDQETGLPIHPEADEENEVDTYFGKKLLGGFHNSIEGPYILYDEGAGYYYLFVSYGNLQSEGGYQIRCYRSENVDGPYVDAAGENCGAVIDHAEYGLKMIGNYTFPSLTYTYMAPGHNSAFIDNDGKKYIVYHQRFDDGQEYHEPRVHQYFINRDGWPVMAPFATMGETLKPEGYKAKEITGTYYVVDHGNDISSKVHDTKEISLNQDGTVSGKLTGTWSMEDGTPYMTITIGDASFHGVFVEMTDEAGNEVMTFTSAASNNQTFWGVHYK